MTRRIALCTAAALAIASLTVSGADAKKKPKRVERTTSASYAAPGGAAGFGLYVDVSGNTIGGVTFPTLSTDRYVSIEITDTTGQAVAATVGQDLDGDAQADGATSICGSSAEPISVEPGYDLTVYVLQGPCTSPAPAPAAATTGDVTATFSNLP